MMSPLDYWNLRNVVEKVKNKKINNFDVKNKVEDLLKKSVKKHMVSDVPIGSFLSGGVDSSLITALMQSQSIDKIKTFNIGFEEKTLDESKHAYKIAKYLGTEHYNVQFSNRDIIDLIPKL